MDIEAVRVEALRKLGRNVVNFAKIEAAFKHLLFISQIKGTSKTIADQLRKNQTRLSRQTLGILIQEFNTKVLSFPNQPDSMSDDFDMEEISIEFQVICKNSDFLKARKHALAKIVKERNKLIHQDLALLDITSTEDYLKSIKLLDEQNPRLLAQLEELRWMIRSCEKLLKTFDEVSKSPDFLEWIQSSKAED